LIVGLEAGIWHVSREYAGIAEAGGLKDVVAGLAAAQAQRGIPVAAVLPRYGFVDLTGLEARRLPLRLKLALPSGYEASKLQEETVEVVSCRHGGVQIFLLDTARIRLTRDVYTYTAEDERGNQYRRRGTGHWDAHHINLTLQRGALELARRSRAAGWRSPPALFHCHDGHAGFLPALLRLASRYCRRLARSRALITVHNAGWGYHQEIHNLEFARQLTGLPVPVLRLGLLEGTVDPLVLGPRFAPVNTVSERYAMEIASGRLDELTGGLGRAYRDSGVRLAGITNGIDPDPYDPRHPERAKLPFGFDPSRGDWEGKKGCRRHLLEQIDMGRPALSAHPGFLKSNRTSTPREFPPDSRLKGLRAYGSLKAGGEAPLFTFVGRLTGQKGVDVLAGAVSRLFGRRAPLRLLILGQGEQALEERLIELASGPAAAGRMCLLIGYNPWAAKLCFAAGDFFLVTSRYEPCGLTDLYAQMMGNLPIVHRVGGLVKVKHGVTGYSYDEHSDEALSAMMLQALEDHHRRPEYLEGMRRQAFAEVLGHYTWERVWEERYLPLYQEVLKGG
jgi:starch synthase